MSSIGCPICFEAFNSESVIVAYGCGHAFHGDCETNWREEGVQAAQWQHNPNDPERPGPRCAVCRRRVDNERAVRLRFHEADNSYSECTEKDGAIQQASTIIDVLMTENEALKAELNALLSPAVSSSFPTASAMSSAVSSSFPTASAMSHAVSSSFPTASAMYPAVSSLFPTASAMSSAATASQVEIFISPFSANFNAHTLRQIFESYGSSITRFWVSGRTQGDGTRFAFINTDETTADDIIDRFHQDTMSLSKLSPLRRTQVKVPTTNAEFNALTVGSQFVKCTGTVDDVFQSTFVSLHILSAEGLKVRVKAFTANVQRLMQVASKGNVVYFQRLRVVSVYNVNYHISPFPYELVFNENSTAEILQTGMFSKLESPLVTSPSSAPLPREIESFSQCEGCVDRISIICALDEKFVTISKGKAGAAIVDCTGATAELFVYDAKFNAEGYGEYMLIRFTSSPTFQDDTLQFRVNNMADINIVSKNIPVNFLHDADCMIIPFKRQRMQSAAVEPVEMNAVKFESKTCEKNNNSSLESASDVSFSPDV